MKNEKNYSFSDDDNGIVCKHHSSSTKTGRTSFFTGTGSTSSANAKPHMHKKHKHHTEPITSFVAGLVGGVIGSLITANTAPSYQQTNTNCITSLSYDGRTQIKNCVETTY